MSSSEVRDKIAAALSLLGDDTTTIAKVEKVLTLVGGVDARIDRRLSQLNRVLSTIKNMQEGDVIELAVENLPEGNEKEKKRKKALIFFIKTFRDLKSEVERVSGEIESAKGRSQGEQAASFAKIAAFAKGPFGIATLIAMVAAGVLVFAKGDRAKTQQVSSTTTSAASPSSFPSPSPSPRQSGQVSPSPAQKIKVITYNGKKIPLDMLAVRTGPDCTNSPSEAAHYHAANGQYVIATDGTQINDPGACAFGKVSETQVEQISPEDNVSEGGFDRTAF